MQQELRRIAKDQRENASDQREGKPVVVEGAMPVSVEKVVDRAGCAAEDTG